MARTLAGDALKKIVEEGIIIQNGTIENSGPLKYDFVLSDDFLKADYGVPTKISELTPETRGNAVVAPGEVVYVLSKEAIHLPQNMFLHLSPNRGLSEYGVLLLGGFAVDPGYSGRLMFGLYNYSSTPFKLMPGKKLVGAVFHELDENETQGIHGFEPPKSIDEFPPRLISIINKYSPMGLSRLEEAVDLVETQLKLVKEEMRDYKYTVDEIKKLAKQAREDLEENNRIVNNLSTNVAELREGIDGLRQGLKEEIDLRKNVQIELDKKLEDSANKINDKFKFLKGALWLATAFSSVIVAAFIAWLAGWLQF